jgi:hypothetical protein
MKIMRNPSLHLPVYGTKLSPSNREISIRPKVILEHQTVKGAIHGLDLVGFILNLHLVEHVSSIKVKMPRRFPEVKVGNVWGVY